MAPRTVVGTGTVDVIVNVGACWRMCVPLSYDVCVCVCASRVTPDLKIQDYAILAEQENM